ncbi:outer envelope pore protein 16, chloroplastic isoform X1 [Nicotiana tabacum]|uniref:Outer envelope pore protein 16, chloroplastic isoform X1 n=1 Tax=Nicotiana tabacum TaxID=4097 RepID=A0A1S4DQ11_TOBAC|nr:PREDICTED: outer envelope pore protein 16, chloroplastic isoform X1 [Nicotiana tabacum]XP_019232819.1 PREDICTED: outer envelope pore protein 16, chloroplastic [Nicotiana attenuata]
MPRSRFSASLASPKVDLVIDMGNPLLNQTVDAFLKIGTVAVTKTAVEETYHIVKKGSVSSHNFENSLKKMCKEGAYWGTVAGVYAGMEYGAERIRGTRDWKNAMIGGALTGALISAASNNNRDKIVMDAITGGAVATAAEFLNYLT